MITFILGALAAAAVGVLVWLSVSIIRSLKRVKSLEDENMAQWREIEERCNSIERTLDQMIKDTNSRIDENFSYTDSRFDKFANIIERDYITKKNKLDNTIGYNN